MVELVHIREPRLLFGHGQALEHPKDGLTLFGPYTAGVGSVRYGVIGTQAGIERFESWSGKVNASIAAYPGSMFTRPKDAEYGKLAHQFFPGFEAAFGLSWSGQPEARCVIPDDALAAALQTHETHTRIARVVKLYANRLVKHHFESEQSPDLWFVVVSSELERLCRPLSDPPKDYRDGTRAEDAGQPSLFASGDDNDTFAEEYEEALQFKPDFHNQLKARLLKHQIITQVLQEETLAACACRPEKPARDKEDPATISWNLATSIFYKTRRRPWILEDARPGICYVGVAFKRLARSAGDKNACCGAQMFLEDGVGMVFKGALGPWYSEQSRECHLSEEEAQRLMARAVASYAEGHDDVAPREVFVHGSAKFNDAEWRGFQAAAAAHGTRTVAVRIRKAAGSVRLFTPGSGAVMRGTAMLLSDKRAYLFTNGFVPRLNTYPGWNTPVPLDVEVSHGQADIGVVLEDIMRLSKLNYNSCKFGDGFPITLKFASKVGDILTTLPMDGGEAEDENEYKPLPFWHYI